jgi:hypothetical protein
MCICVAIALHASEFLLVSMGSPSAVRRFRNGQSRGISASHNRGLGSFTPRSSLGGAAEHGPTTGTEGVEISHHAGGDLILVRNVIAA